jgi:hypothetical protein
MFATFFKYLASGEDLVDCRPFPTITALVITNGCVYIRQKPVKQNVGEDLISNTQQVYSSEI